MDKNLKQTKNTNLIKIVLFGPESTGKTTLAKQLADYYNTQWVPEYMRFYLQNKWNTCKQKCTVEDLLPIAKGQILQENTLAEKANAFLFCDTNLLELKVYSEIYYNGFCPPEIEKAASENQYHFYFLMYIDTPWIKDDLRDKPNEREEQFAIFESALQKANLPYQIIKGKETERLKMAIKTIEKLGFTQ